MDEKFLGNLISYDPVTNLLTIRADFIDIETQKSLEDIIKSKKIFSFQFKKMHRREKTYEQLKKYFAMLKNILVNMNIFPDADIMKAFDIEIKKTALSCKKLEILGSEVPLVPSKADLSIEEMSYLIQYVLENYDEILDEEHKQVEY